MYDLKSMNIDEKNLFTSLGRGVVKDVSTMEQQCLKCSEKKCLLNE